MSARAKLWLDLLLFLSVFVTLATGLVLLFAFHVGGGCFEREALGAARLCWQNIHRFGALLTLSLLLIHVATNAKTGLARLRRLSESRRAPSDVRESLFYVAFTLVCATGFFPWFFLAGGTPVFGPTPVGPLLHARHQWIDAHLIAGICSIYLLVRHLILEWRPLRALIRRTFEFEGAVHRQPQSREQLSVGHIERRHTV